MSTTSSNGSNAAPYAIVETSGTQVWVQPNRYYDLNRINAEVDSSLTLETVLLVNDGNAASVGQPYVTGATV
jgi:large subunit ribosomal protein L21